MPDPHPVPGPLLEKGRRWKVAWGLPGELVITTAPKGPYRDRFGPDGLLRYKYREEDRPSVLLLESRYERFLEVATAPGCAAWTEGVMTTRPCC